MENFTPGAARELIFLVAVIEGMLAVDQANRIIGSRRAPKPEMREV